MALPAVNDVRRWIAAGAPHDEREARRMAQRATSRVVNASVAQRLRELLTAELMLLVQARESGAPGAIAHATQVVEARLSDIEHISRVS